MKTLILLLLFISLNATAQSFKNSNWGDAPEKVLEKEKGMVFLGEESLDRNLSGLTFVEDGSEGIFFTHTYLFYNNKFYGVRTKKEYLDGDNNLYKALTDYNEKLESYRTLYDELLKEKSTDNNYEFQVKLADKTLFVSVKKEDHDYYLVESIFTNKEN